MCLVQEGQISTENELRLKAQINDFSQRAFAAPADIDWIVVPSGNGFTAAAPSKSVIASLHANRALSRDERVAFLGELCDICMTRTGLSANEVVTSIRNPKV
ncbi:hypothetical protein [Hoeflea poritis]|uniref:Uncharacterized protein n=1 Tax=Hoeflea poritis TaxID=2993659 RepID=A0ABT4VKC3_9HYPH|nr:hypothetical protein [Hoeflea poritis]MDA4845166.1 hypothetical protein [Hoeflea poritis]